MTIAQMLQQSTVLTVLGMTVVFGFLLMMVIAVYSVGKIIHALGWDRATGQPKSAAGPAGGVKPELAAAITAAVNEYRRTGQ